MEPLILLGGVEPSARHLTLLDHGSTNVGKCITQCACLCPRYYFNSLRVPKSGWPGWVDMGGLLTCFTHLLTVQVLAKYRWLGGMMASLLGCCRVVTTLMGNCPLLSASRYTRCFIKRDHLFVFFIIHSNDDQFTQNLYQHLIWFTNEKCLSCQHWATCGHEIRRLAIQKTQPFCNLGVLVHCLARTCESPPILTDA